MDYGSYLKRQGVRLNAKSHHYRKQPPLKGSVREVRGQLVKLLAEGTVSYKELRRQFADDPRFRVAFEGLLRDGLVELVEQKVRLSR